LSPNRQGGGSGGGAIASVFGRTGTVTAQSSDYGAFYPLLSGSYSNPSWITSLGWSKLTGVPATFAPTAHAASHSSGQSDALSVDATQTTSGTFNAARIPDLSSLYTRAADKTGNGSKIVSATSVPSDGCATWSGGNLSTTGLTCGSAGGGEVNTASNQGTAGIGVFFQKSVVDLQFYKLNALSNKISIAKDVANNKIDFDVVPGNLGLEPADATLVKSSGVRTLEAITVYDASGKVIASGCKVTSGTITCGDGTASSMISFPELAVNGTNHSAIYGADNQASDACIVWPAGTSTTGQVAADSGSPATMTDGSVCRVFTWQTISAATTTVRGTVTTTTATSQVVSTDDSRMSDARTPAVHAASHENGGADEVATATPATNAIPKADAAGKLAAGWLPNPAAAALGGVQSKTCSGTDKLSAIGTDGVPVCSPDQSAGGTCSLLSATGDYFTPGMAFALNAYPDTTAAAVYPNFNAANSTLLVHVYIPCAWTPNKTSFNVLTAGAAGCKMEVGVYNSSGTLIVRSGVVTDVTTVKCNSLGVKSLTSGTSPAASGMGTQYAAGWYYMAWTSNETGFTGGRRVAQYEWCWRSAYFCCWCYVPRSHNN
jgi:hypothetical protein